MPWVRLDDRFPSHRKVALLSDRAFRLHVSAICWCAENLTDGHIRERELTLVAHVRSLKATAQQLEDAGLWDRVDGGWVIHDYLSYNPSREQVIAERKKNAARQEAFRRRRNGKPVPPDPSSNGRSNGVTRSGETHADDTNAARRRHDGDTTANDNRSVSEEESQVSAFRNGVTNGAPTRPDPNPIDVADVDGGGNGSSATDLDAFAPTPIEVDGFQLTDAMRRWAHATYPHVDIDHSTAQFVSHYRSTGARRKSWPDAWQKWVRDDAQRAPRRLQHQPANVIQLPSGQTLTGTDAKVAGWAAIAASFESEDSA
ncbi:hypothetical protein [Streptomyces himalayensis]|uniref:Uncharacterized protein n=1 Tax=Streptomyces himalayensis subsp. himalayensis TaxID=2756131 RepID=A0A7W0IDT0_9ACTN|nr:hypothetical protein [Streptomyces himalayensis]MBA2951632.1 hypothetical protein [Streptomyces himalayensis subsp. himalayensis]